MSLLNGAAPAFDLDQGGILLALVRGLAVAGLLAAFGTLLFRSVVAPPALRRTTPAEAAGLDRRVVWLALAALAWAGLGLLAWLPVQAGTMVGAHSLAAMADAMPAVVTDTRFGHVVLLQLACVLLTGLALWRMPDWRWLATLLAGAGVALQSGHSHSSAMQPFSAVLFGSEMLHLLAAGAWLGGLLPLLAIVREAPCRVGAAACRYFSPLGKWCLAAMVATAGVQFWELIGGLPGLVGTAYGWVAGGKIVLFGVLFGFALVNRYRLAPALLGADAEVQRRLLVRSIAVQSVFGLAVVLAAGVLSQLSPAIHTQAVWPFTDQPSLTTVREDPEFRDEVTRAALMLAGAAVILVVPFVTLRRRWFALPGVVVAGVLTWLAVPHLDLLFIPATPTSFYRSPTSFSTETIVAGAALYPGHCASCHGADGRGDGPQAAALPVPPADLTAPHLWEHPDGELFWWLSHGMEAPEGGLAMPGFADVLGDDDIWALIDFIRAHNAGVAHAASGVWSPPVQAPSFQMSCGEVSQDLTDLRGRVVRLVFGPVASAVAGDVLTVSTASGPAGPGVCTADDGSVRAAYAIVAGVPAERLAGAEVLIDANGWLREVRPAAGGAGDTAEIHDIAAHPLQAAEGGGHHHH